MECSFIAKHLENAKKSFKKKIKIYLLVRSNGTACNPSYLGGRDQEMAVQVRLQQKCETTFEK
jgi:hypothetical protein